MSDLKASVAAFCQKYAMLSPRDTVLACVSGGADSMCLLEVLRRLSAEMGFSLCAAHFNHNLRGAESDGDEAFVREYCDTLGIPLYVGSGDVAAEAKRRSKGIEETARALRYAFFFKIAGERDIARVATAHNADDNLETVLMRISRGTGLRGLCGIPPVSGRLIRPLLGATRAQIEEFNRENGVPHREDSTNAADEYSRNLLRHAAVPVLRRLNPAVNVTEMTGLLRRDEEFLTGLARDFLRENLSGGALPLDALAALPFPVASRAVRLFCGTELDAGHVEALLRQLESPDPAWSLSLPGVTVRREYGALRLGKAERSTFERVEIPLDRRVIIEAAGFAAICENIVNASGIYNSLTSFLIKRDKIVGKLSLRPRAPGDRLRLPGKPGSRSLKKLLIDKRIPRHLRDGLPVVADEAGAIAVYGLGEDVSFIPAPGEPAIKIEIHEKEK